MTNNFFWLAAFTLGAGFVLGYSNSLGERLRSKVDLSRVALLVYVVAVGANVAQFVGAGLAIVVAFVDGGLVLLVSEGFYRVFKWLDKWFDRRSPRPLRRDNG